MKGGLFLLVGGFVEEIVNWMLASPRGFLSNEGMEYQSLGALKRFFFCPWWDFIGLMGFRVVVC